MIKNHRLLISCFNPSLTLTYHPTTTKLDIPTFHVENEAPLGETRLTGSKPDDDDIRSHLDHLFTQRSAFPEVGLTSARDVEKVVTGSVTFHVQFEVVEGDANRLVHLNGQVPPAFGVQVVFPRVVGTGKVSSVEEPTVRGFWTASMYAGAWEKYNGSYWENVRQLLLVL